MQRAQLEHLIRVRLLRPRGRPGDRQGAGGWEERLVLVEGPGTNQARGWCLEAHDLVLAKCVAGREKDLAFARAALAAGLVGRGALLDRVDALPIGADHRDVVRRLVRGLLPPS